MPFKKNKILVVDDEQSIREFLTIGLEAEGFEVAWAGDGVAAINLAVAFQPQIVLLDVMLPGMSGFVVCEEIKKFCKTSIIFLSAKDETDEKVKGLNLGADDYLSKPFSFTELLARIHARLRASSPQNSAFQSIGPFIIDDQIHEIRYYGAPLSLSLTEYQLLSYLVINQGIVLSKQQILENVWGIDFIGDDNIVEVYIGYLRRKINDTDFSVVRTLRGVGYKVQL